MRLLSGNIINKDKQEKSRFESVNVIFAMFKIKSQFKVSLLEVYTISL